MKLRLLWTTFGTVQILIHNNNYLSHLTTFAQKAFQQNIWRSHCYMITLSQEKLFMVSCLFHKRKRICTHYNDEKYKESPVEQDRIQINPNNLPTPGL